MMIKRHDIPMHGNVALDRPCFTEYYRSPYPFPQAIHRERFPAPSTLQNQAAAFANNDCSCALEKGRDQIRRDGMRRDGIRWDDVNNRCT